MQLEKSELSEASIAAESARDVALCLESARTSGLASRQGHECLACGWEAEELVKIETRALRALLHLPNSIREDSEAILDSNPEMTKEDPMSEQDDEKDLDRASARFRGSVRAAMVVCEANFLVSECFAAVLRTAVAKEAWKLDLIGSHGQTIWHHPSSAKLLPSILPKKNSTDHDHQHKSTPKEGERHDENSSNSESAKLHHQHHQHLGRISSTLQIGDGSVLSSRMGVTCVSNFRSADVARGGQGAPLTSSLDSFLLSHLAHKSQGWIALQNLGGMGNVTLIPSHALVMNIAQHSRHRQQIHENSEVAEMDEREERSNTASSFSASVHPVAFDTGPANVLLDWFVSTEIDTQAEYDEEGAHAAQGRVNETLLQYMLGHPYFAVSTPKTCGREVFTAALGEKWWKESKNERYGAVSETDFLATLTDLTAVSVVLSYLRFTPRAHHASWYLKSHTLPTNSSSPALFSPFPSHIYVSGGGSHNVHLMSRIEFYARLAQQGKLDVFEQLVFGDKSASDFMIAAQGSVKTSSEDRSRHQPHNNAEKPLENLESSSHPSHEPQSSESLAAANISPAVVSSHTSTGISADEKESVLFAMLAFFTLHGIPSSIPACTGAHEASVLGTVAPGPNWRVIMRRALN